MNIKGKSALVLGASRPVGRAIARALHVKGAHLILPWLDWPEDSQKMEQEFSSPESRNITMRCDLCSEKDITLLCDKIKNEFGCLDILINNIERGGMPIVHGSYDKEVNRKQWQLEQDTTLQAKWQVFQRCLPLLQNTAQAIVINLSSIAALTGRSGPAGLVFSDGYAAANRSIASFTENWARIGAPNIRVNEIMLGIIDHRHGPGTRGWELLTDDEKNRLIDHILLRQTGKPQSVAKVVEFLIQDGEYMTGSVLRLDGGYLLGGETVPPLPDGVL